MESAFRVRRTHPLLNPEIFATEVTKVSALLGSFSHENRFVAGGKGEYFEVEVVAVDLAVVEEDLQPGAFAAHRKRPC